jgi:hypothetical protein
MDFACWNVAAGALMARIRRRLPTQQRTQVVDSHAMIDQ